MKKISTTELQNLLISPIWDEPYEQKNTKNFKELEYE